MFIKVVRTHREPDFQQLGGAQASIATGLRPEETPDALVLAPHGQLDAKLEPSDTTQLESKNSIKRHYQKIPRPSRNPRFIRVTQRS